MSIESSEIERIIASLKAEKTPTSEDWQILAAAFKAGQISIATGDRSASIGGTADGAVVITGNGNIVITGANAEAIRDLLAVIGTHDRQQAALAEHSIQTSVAPLVSGRSREQPMNFKRQRLERQRQTLQSEWETRSDKLERLRQALTKEAGERVRFQLESEIKEEETAIAKLEEQLSAIEESLNGDDKPEKK